MPGNRYSTPSGMCNQDCPGCFNCLSMAPPRSGGSGRGTYYSYSRTETLIVTNATPEQIEPLTRTIRSSDDINEIKNQLSQLSMNSQSESKSQPRRKSGGVSGWLDNIGEDEVVNSQSPNQLLLEAPRGHSSSRSYISAPSHRSSRSRRSSRDLDDDARTVVTLASVTPSESASGISSRRSDISHATRRSSHPESSRVGSRVSTRTRDDDESTVRGPRPKDSVVSSRRGSGSEAPNRASTRHHDDKFSRVTSRHPDDKSSRVTSRQHDGASRVASRTKDVGASTVAGSRMSSTVSSRHPAGSEVVSRIGSRHGGSEVSSRLSTCHRSDDATLLASRIEELPDSVVSSRHPSVASSRHFSRDGRSYVTRR